MNIYSLKIKEECLKGLSCIDSLDYETAIAIGNFDGVHIGHQHLVKRLVEEAKLRGIKPVILSFYPHPLKVLSPDQAPCELTNLHERADILASLDVYACLFIKFTKEFSLMKAEDFLKDIVHRKLRCKFLLVGYDWRFGYKREGEIELAKELGKELGYDVSLFEPFKINGHIVSSTLIRRLLHTGRIDEATQYLGRKYSLVRKVIKGDGRGSKIGFPTANLEGSENLCLKEGVYAVRVNNEHIAIANYGYRPTFGGRKKILEVHIIHKNINLYGQKIKVEFLEFIREEKKFSSSLELINQIKEDISKVLMKYA